MKTKISTLALLMIVMYIVGLSIVISAGKEPALAVAPYAESKLTGLLVSQDNHVVIDYHSVDASEIPQAWLDQARLMDTFFAHMSVGNNILDGLAALESQNPTRYAIDISTDSASWFASHGGILHSNLSNNYYPLIKVNTFNNLIRQQGYSAAQIAMMKFCPGDVPPIASTPAVDTWVAYRDMMESLSTDFPGVEFVWWTFPLASASDNRGNDQREIFNTAVRSYCETNGCTLFDIADIESHDPNGNPVVSGTGHEAMWDGYSEDGGHLNAIGRLRVAQACWHLLARMAGWNSTSSLSITAMNNDVSVDVGASATYILNVTSDGTLTQPVTLLLDGAPAGVETDFSPNSFTPPETSHLVVTTTTATAFGLYPMTVTADSGGVQDIVALTLTVNPTITLSAEPLTQSVLPGEWAMYTLIVDTSEGFSGPVQLVIEGMPPGAYIRATPNPVDSQGSSQLSIFVQPTTFIGSYPMTVTAQTSTVQSTAYITLVVNPTMSLAVKPAVMDVIQSETAVYTLTLTASQGYVEPVTFTLQDSPTGAYAFSPNPIVSPGGSHLSMTTTILTTPGIYAMVAVAESAELTATAAIDFVVMSPQPPDYSINISPTMRTVVPGKMVTYTVEVTSSGSFNELVTLSALGLPERVEIDWSANPVIPGTEVVLTCTVLPDHEFDDYLFMVAGVNGGSPVVVDAALIIDYPYKVYLPLVMK